MFIGRLADLPVQRACLPAAIVRALDALNALDLATLPNGRHELEGDRLFVLIQDATPRAIEDSRIEAHATYADIQLPLGARECFGFSLAQPGLAACDDQLAERDLAFYPDPENEAFIDVAPCEYIVFLPGELHRPCLAVEGEGSAPFRKAVLKIHRELLGLN